MNIFSKIQNPIKFNEHFREILRKGFFSFILQLCGKGAAYGFTLFVTIHFGASVWGGFALTFAIVKIISIIGKMGLDIAFVKLVPLYRVSDDWYALKVDYLLSLLVSFIIGWVLALFLFLLAPFLVSHVFHDADIEYQLKLFAALIPFMGLLHINAGGFRGFKNIFYYSFFQNTSIFLFAVIFILLGWLFTDTVNLPFFAFFYAVLGSAVLSLFLFYKKHAHYWLHLKIAWSFPDLSNRFRKLFNLSSPLMLASAMMFLMGWVDTIMIGFFADAKQVGIYNVCIKIAEINTFFLIAVNSIAAPKIAEFFSKSDFTTLKIFLSNVSKLIFFLTAPVLLVLLINPKFFLGIFGAEFEGAWLTLVILIISRFINSITGIVGYTMQMSGDEKKYQLFVSVAVIMNIVLNLILIPAYGIKGAAIASLVSLAAWKLTGVVFLKNKYNLITFFMPFYQTKRK